MSNPVWDKKKLSPIINCGQFICNLSIYLYTYKTLITLIVCLFVCLFEAVHTNPGYGMATLI